jgi:WD40 repeat protein
MFCGEFCEAAAQLKKKTELVLDEAHDVRRALDLFCGKQLYVNLQEALQMAEVADKYDFREVLAAIEEALILRVGKDSCLQIADHGCSAMPRLKEAAVKAAAFWFEEVMSDASRMRAGSLADLLGDDRLIASSEEVVWAVVQEWVRLRITAGCLSSHEFRQVAESVRLALMRTQSLKDVDSWARALNIAAADAAWLEEMVKEALVAKELRAAGSITAESKFIHLKRNAHEERTGNGVKWTEYTTGGVRRSPMCFQGSTPKDQDDCDDSEEAVGIKACPGRIVTATGDRVRILNYEGRLVHSLSTVRFSEESDSEDSSGRGYICRRNRAQISAFDVYRKGGVVITGDSNGEVREWDLETGECISTLAAPVESLAALCCGRPGGQYIHELAVWAFGGTRYLAVVVGNNMRPAVWTQTGTRNPDDCRPWIELDLAAHSDSGCSLRCLAGWDDKLLSGMVDGAIRVWEFGTTARATVTGKTGFDAHKPQQTGSKQKQTARKRRFDVVQLLVRKELLVSTSFDSTIRVWTIGSWVLKHKIEASRPGVFYSSLIFSGTKLLGLERGNSEAKQLLVWGLADSEGRLQLEHRVDIPYRFSLDCLVAVDGQVWGAAGEVLMVWGQHSLALPSQPRSASSPAAAGVNSADPTPMRGYDKIWCCHCCLLFDSA